MVLLVSKKDLTINVISNAVSGNPHVVAKIMFYGLCKTAHKCSSFNKTKFNFEKLGIKN